MPCHIANIVDCVIEDGYEYYIGDDKEYSDQWKNAEECADWCARSDTCQFWTYYRDYEMCWLMSSKDGKYVQAEYISGNKACGKSTTTPPEPPQTTTENTGITNRKF